MFPRLLQVDPLLPHSLFLFGPRGTGKTSWVRTVFPGALYLDLLKTQDYTLLHADPSRLEGMVLARPQEDWIVIDEIQKIPALLDEVHRLIEQYGRRFVLTGSSSRKLKQAGTNLLAGRARVYKMHPLMAIEIGSAFDLRRALSFGTLPTSYLSQDPQSFLESYVETYLREEVIQEGLVRQAGLFHRFMEIASFSQGAPLNLSNIAREVGISRKIVENYFNILEDLLISIRIPPFEKRAERMVIQHTKFYYFDVGVYRHLRPRGPLDSLQEIDGVCCESLFLQQIRAWIDSQKLQLHIYFWRTRTGREVDFVLYGNDGFFAFEIKSGTVFHKKDLGHLKAFQEEYPEVQSYLIYNGNHEEQHGTIRVVPLKHALLNLHALIPKKASPPPE